MSKTRGDGLVRAAIVVGAAAVLARGTMVESLRDPFGVTPGSEPYARGAGPAAGMVLDLLCCVPALLVLLNRTLAKTPMRHKSLACALSALLAGWTAASVFWSDDKFAAVVSASHVAAAFALLWAASQCVDRWSRLRLVGALAHGLLLVYLTQAVLYRYTELPATREYYFKHKDEFLKQRGWKADEFLARQFEKKLVSGEMVFFHGSSNSFAATLVLLLGISGGLVIDRVANRESPLAGATALAVPATFWILYYTQSKAALVTPVLIAAILLVRWRWKTAMTYTRGAGLVLLAGAALVGTGLIHHGLPGASLNFRWRYWTAAWQMFLARPLLGVGWSNFGHAYLRYRLPIAAEEIQDPHDFPLRWLTELGVIGAALGLAWLGRLWWELTRTAASPKAAATRLGIGMISLIAFGAMAINAAASVDDAFDLIKRMLFICVLVGGASIAGIRSMADPELNDRPAPWLLYAMLASWGAFLIHNLIEFSLFETGPLMLFALLAGSALGVRRPAVAASRGASGGWLVFAATAWAAVLVMLVVPVVVAESLAAQGDDLLRAGQFDRACADYQSAYRDHVNFNADYLYRAALAIAYNPRGDRAAARGMLDEAIAANPSSVIFYLSRGRVSAEMHDLSAAQADFAAALGLNPNEVAIRLEYAGLLKRSGLADQAAEQYALARKFNDLLPAEEPKRLSEEDMAAKEKE